MEICKYGDYPATSSRSWHVYMYICKSGYMYICVMCTLSFFVLHGQSNLCNATLSAVHNDRNYSQRGSGAEDVERRLCSTDWPTVLSLWCFRGEAILVECSIFCSRLLHDLWPSSGKVCQTASFFDDFVFKVGFDICKGPFGALSFLCHVPVSEQTLCEFPSISAGWLL